MKYKTTLFYPTGPDSKFLTFSNYTDSLTGSFLSTNNKLYPTGFLALNIPGLDTAEAKSDFISQYLTGYYENKLAFLRESAIYNNLTSEDFICPLNILLECINMWNKNGGDPAYDPQVRKIDIVYAGDVTEQDYNGVYADTICTLDLNNATKGEVEYTEVNLDESALLASEEHLHGWSTNELNTIDDSNQFNVYKNMQAIYDKEDLDPAPGETIIPSYYYTKSDIAGISLSQNTDNSITFNAIILLYDMIDITENNENTSSILENDYIDLNINTASNILYNRYAPYGIWISDNPITISKDYRTNLAPVWSLSVLSQFKPLPYNNVYNIDSINDTTDEESEATNVDLTLAEQRANYTTFTQVLARQNEIIDKYEEVIKKYNNSITTQLDTLGEAIERYNGAAEILTTFKDTLTELANRVAELESRIDYL